MQTIAVLLATFNRRDLSERIINQLIIGTPEGVNLKIFVTDGGSDDGTIEMFREKFPFVNLQVKPGFYWCQAMISSWKMSLENQPDLFLWLNDDVNLKKEALMELLIQHELVGSSAVLIGKLCDTDSGLQTYGGYRYEKSFGSVLKLRRLLPEENECHTMNGNVVLVPYEVYGKHGMLSPKFKHYWGDIEYGFRLSRSGTPLIESENFLGTLENNPLYKVKVKIRNVRDLMNYFKDPKGLSFFEWLYFSRNFGGFLWPIHFVSHIFSKMQIITKRSE